MDDMEYEVDFSIVFDHLLSKGEEQRSIEAPLEVLICEKVHSGFAVLS